MAGEILKIVYITNRYYAISETFIRDLSLGLASLGNDVFVLADQLLSDPKPNERLDIRKVPFVYRPGRFIRLALKFIEQLGMNYEHVVHNIQLRFARRKLQAHIKGISPDVIYVEYGTNGILISPLAKELGVPLVVHFHGFDASSEMKSNHYRNRVADLMSFASRIIVPSQHLRRLLTIGVGTSAKTEVVPCSPDQTLIDSIGRVEKFTAPTVLFLGRLTPKKNPLALLQAFDLVQSKIPQARLIMIGDGPLREELENRVALLGLQDCVELMGAMAHTEALMLLAKSWVFAQHSVTAPSGDQEGLPVSILEACALGVPVVSTIHSGIPEAITDTENGFLVREHDYEEMADKVLELLTNSSLRAEFGETGRHVVRNRFQLTTRVVKISDIFESTIN